MHFLRDEGAATLMDRKGTYWGSLLTSISVDLFQIYGLLAPIGSDMILPGNRWHRKGEAKLHF